MPKLCPNIRFPHQEDFFPIRSVTKSSTSRFSYENLVEKSKIFGQDFVPIRTALTGSSMQMKISNAVDVPIYRPVLARPKRTGKQGKPVYRGKRPHVHKKSRCISTDFDMACLCFSCCRGSLQLQYY